MQEVEKRQQKVVAQQMGLVVRETSLPPRLIDSCVVVVVNNSVGYI